MYESSNPAKQLADYVKKNLSKGYTLDSLRFSLISQGYSKITVERAIEQASKQLAEKIPEVKEKPTITYKVITEDEQGREKVQEIKPEKKGFFQRLFRE